MAGGRQQRLAKAGAACSTAFIAICAAGTVQAFVAAAATSEATAPPCCTISPDRPNAAISTHMPHVVQGRRTMELASPDAAARSLIRAFLCEIPPVRYAFGLEQPPVPIGRALLAIKSLRYGAVVSARDPATRASRSGCNQRAIETVNAASPNGRAYF